MAPPPPKNVHSWTRPFSSFWGSITRESEIGDTWDSSNAEKSFRNGEICSNRGGSAVRLAFRNATPWTLIFCWVSKEGVLTHFRPILPSQGAENDVITSWDHLENSFVGHAFVLGCCEDLKKAKTEKKLDSILAGYRPTQGMEEKEDCLHLITISERAPRGITCGIGRNKRKQVEVRVRLEVVDKTPLDTSEKTYKEESMGGWPVRLEEDWNGGDKRLKQLYERHFKAAVKCLPKHAQTSLRATTPFYINKSQQYGPLVCPVTGRGMCFHPVEQWLVENGMTPKKSECIEIYEAGEYPSMCDLWGEGGALLHELCHAYHWKVVPDGYKNKEIKECYKAAMEEGLYDSVKVHGSQGPTARAYACTNAMEYFAELSVAFLGGLKKSQEYNKWQPFNRSELKDFDPRAYKLLQKVWKVKAP